MSNEKLHSFQNKYQVIAFDEDRVGLHLEARGVEGKAGAQVELPLVPGALQNFAVALERVLVDRGRDDVGTQATAAERPALVRAAVANRVVSAVDAKDPDPPRPATAKIFRLPAGISSARPNTQRPPTTLSGPASSTPKTGLVPTGCGRSGAFAPALTGVVIGRAPGTARARCRSRRPRRRSECKWACRPARRLRRSGGRDDCQRACGRRPGSSPERSSGRRSAR